jgi:plastocyanin
MLFVVACGGGEPAPAEKAPAQPAAIPGAPVEPAPGGRVIVVMMNTDAAGNNTFTPKDFTVSPGDVMRFTLESGVHNVHFLADSNRTMSPLPPASPLLQLPGQTYDIPVNFAPGRYFFQCDPHALLGMVGAITVTDRS